jgi:ATP-binding cassette subfamily F protein uup
VIVGDTIKIGYYTQSGIILNQDSALLGIRRIYSAFKGRMISASQLLERFLFDAKKQYDYVEKLSGELKRLYLCTV